MQSGWWTDRQASLRQAAVACRISIRLPLPSRGVEAPVAGEVVVPLHRELSGLGDPRDDVDVVDQECRMRLAGRRERLLDADMDLDSPVAEPDTATGREHRRLADFGQTQYAAVERPRRGLAATRTRHLDMVQSHDASFR
jgi:hypothetical protein